MALSDLDRELIGISSAWDNDEKLNRIKDLLKEGANPNASTELGYTPLHLAADENRSATIDLLLEHGADMGAKNHKGQTPLHVAVIEGRSEIGITLLERGADPNAKDNLGRTPLHHVAMWLWRSYIPDDWDYLCETLLEKGANPLEKDKAGMTALDIALNGFLSKYGWVLINGDDGKKMRIFLRRNELIESTANIMRYIGSYFYDKSEISEDSMEACEIIGFLAKAAGIDCEISRDWITYPANREGSKIPCALNEFERTLIAMLFRLSMPYGFRASPLPDVFLSFETPPLFVAYPELEEEIRQSREVHALGNGLGQNPSELEEEIRQSREESVTEADVRKNRCSPAERSMQGRSIVESEELPRLRNVLSEITPPPEAFPIEEVLGYYETKPRIVLYQRGLDWFSGKYGLDQELLRAVVLLHEASHWFTHLAPGPSMSCWPTRYYKLASEEVHEGLAQLLSWWVVNEAGGRLKYTFEELNKRQSPPYLVFEGFKSESREKMLRSLEDMRGRRYGMTTEEWGHILRQIEC